MLVSIFIPSYNKIDVIEATIISVVKNIRLCLSHNVKAKFEFSIVDDRSSDGTYKLLEKLQNTYDYTLFQNEQNLGLVDNWNQCIDKSKGDFLLILHSDDLLVDGSLIFYIEYLKRNPDAKFLHGNAIDISLPYLKFTSRITQNKEVLQNGDEAVAKILLNNNLACSTVMVAKECYDRLGTFDVNAWVSPDWEMWARIGAHYNIHHLEHTTAYVIHNQNNTHVSGIPINIFRKQQLYYINKILALLKKNESYYRKKAMDNLDITVWYLSIKYRLIGNRPMAKDYLKVVKETNARKLKRSYLVSKALIRMHLLKVLNRRHTLQYALSKVNKVL